MPTSLLVFDPTFYRRADEFAKQHPRYQGKSIVGTRYHISNAAIACGFNEVTAENIDQVFAALEQRAAQTEAQA